MDGLQIKFPDQFHVSVAKMKDIIIHITIYIYIHELTAKNLKIICGEECRLVWLDWTHPVKSNDSLHNFTTSLQKD